MFRHDALAKGRYRRVPSRWDAEFGRWVSDMGIPRIVASLARDSDLRITNQARAGDSGSCGTRSRHLLTGACTSMRINLQIDSAQLVLRLQNGQRRLAYAVVNAINNTAKRIQEVERRRRVAEPVVGGPARPRFTAAVTPELRVGKLRFDRTKTGRRRAARHRSPYRHDPAFASELTPANRSIDHRVALILGGLHTSSNLAACCLSCNRTKAWAERRQARAHREQARSEYSRFCTAVIRR